MAKKYEKPYVRPVILGCFGKKGCPIPKDENSRKEVEKALTKDAKGKRQ